MAMLGAANLSDSMVHYGSAALAGGVQRLAWQKSQNVGMMVTGATLLAGLIGEGLFPPGIRDAVRSASMAAAGIAGWTAAERFYVLPAMAKAYGAPAARQYAQIGAGSSVRAGVGQAIGVPQPVVNF